MRLTQAKRLRPSQPVWEPGLVSVVVLNWNGGAEVLRCLEQVEAQTYRQVELIVVDNGSTDGSVEEARRSFPAARVVDNGRNLGYAAGMNIGIRHSRGEFVVLLNQDAYLQEDYLRIGVGLLQRNDAFSMVAPRVLDVDAQGHHAGKLIHCGWMMRWHMRPFNSLACDERREVFGPSFACAMIRRAALEDIECGVYGDYLDEDYFSYHEDIDLCFRLVLRGWKALYDPRLIVYHSRGSATGGRVRTIEKPLFFQRHVFKNRYLTIVKDLPLLVLLRALPAIGFAEVALLGYILLKSPQSFWAWTRACGDFIQLLPRALRRREYIQSRVMIANNDLQQYFVRF